MNEIIASTLQTLQKSKSLLSSLSNEELANDSISPYYSSIGSHIRHIYDFYDCALNFNDEGEIDLTARKRNFSCESNCGLAVDYLDRLINKLRDLNITNNSIIVNDDLGCGKIKIEYTYSALLAQANSHTIHHYAIINYILDRLNITIEDNDFGYNPTTPKKVLSTKV